MESQSESEDARGGIPLSRLAGTVFSLNATPRRFRFVDCRSLLRDGLLKVREMEALPATYAAVSYVWRGLEGDTADSKHNMGAFSVRGAENGEPICIRLLRTICLAAKKSGCD